MDPPPGPAVAYASRRTQLLPAVALAALSLLAPAACGDGDGPGARVDAAAGDAAGPALDATGDAPPPALDGARPPDAGLDAAPPPGDAAPPPDTGPPELPACPELAPGEPVGTVAAAELTEASGLVASRQHVGVLWVHNDSGDEARVFALAEDGTHLGTLSLRTPRPRDIEDLAIAPASGGGWELWLGDIGDNDSVRAGVTLLCVREPEALPPERPFLLEAEVTAWTVTYPDGAHNAETLLADPETGDLFIVEKTDATDSGVYRLAAPAGAGGDLVAERVTTVQAGLTTGGDVSPDGREIVVRGYGRTASLWRRVPGTTLVDAFTTEPCEVRVHAEPQAEALGFAPDGSGYYTVSEGSAQPIYRYLRL